MKQKKWLCYVGYAVSLLCLGLAFLPNLSNTIQILLCAVFGVVSAVSHTKLIHLKMYAKDKNYRVDINDERNIALREKTGNSVNIINLFLMSGAAMVGLILKNRTMTAAFFAILALQPVLLIAVSRNLENKM